MDESTLRRTVAANIAFYRRQNGQTQAELAEKLNYSDKSVSKWERAEGVPDVFVLTQIAALYGITVNDLLRTDPPPTRTPLPGRILISLLSVGLVWLVAATVYVALRIAAPQMTNAWIAFIFALPVSCIVMVVFTALWWRYLWQCVATSCLVWSLALSIFLMARRTGVPLIFLVAGIMQVLIILWFIFKHRLDKERAA